jgi:hypothetical protein
LSFVTKKGAVLDFIQIRHGFLVWYQNYEGNKNPVPIVRKGTPNEANIRRFKRCFFILLYFSDVKENTTKKGKRFRWRLNFITLTLPAKTSKADNVQNAFSLFRKKLVYHGNVHFIWRKEIQPQTGRIHWHIVTNKFIHYNTLQEIWNDSLKKHAPETIKKFQKKHGHKNPPSTEVRAIREIGRCVKYMGKYIAKEGLAVPGNVFGVSRALGAIRYPAILAEDLTEPLNFHFTEVTDFCQIANAEFVELPENMQNIYREFSQKTRETLN